MSDTRTADVIVIGSGIVGSSCAYYCAKKGLSVIVLDEDIIGNGASSRNGGGVRVSGREPQEIPLAKYAIDHIWPHLSEELGVDIEYEKGGNLRLATTEAEYDALKKFVVEMKNWGLRINIMDQNESKEQCPYINDKVFGTSICLDDGHANPMVTTLAFYKKNREMGVQYYTGEEAVRLKLKQGKVHAVVTASSNIYESDHVIVAAGLKSRNILNTVEVDIPLVPRLIEIFVTEPIYPMFKYMLGTIGSNGGFYGHQTKHGSFVFGGTTGFEFSPKVNLEKIPTYELNAPSIMRGVLNYFPMLKNLKVIRTWSGWTDPTTEWVPCVGPVSEIDGLYVAVGFSGHGFCLGPIVGKILSETIVGETVSVNCDLLRYNRFKAIQ